MSTSIGAAAPSALGSRDPGSVRELEDRRSDLIDDYLHARPQGEGVLKNVIGAGAGMLGAAAGMGAVVLANRGKGPLYQGINIMFTAPIAMGIGGAAVGLTARSLVEIAGRPTGAAATTQVNARRDQLRGEIADVDAQLHELDGRVAGRLPSIEDPAPPGITPLRTLGAVGAGTGLGALGMVGVESALGFTPDSGRIPARSASFGFVGAGAATWTAVSLLNHHDEAAGGQGSWARSAAIGAGVFGAASLLPGMSTLGVATMPRAAGALAIGAAFGSIAHMVSASSRD